MTEKEEMINDFRFIFNFVRNTVSKNYSHMHLGDGQLRLIMYLMKDKEGKSQEELSKDLELDKTSITRAIKRLEGNGYVKRERNPKDRRSYSVYLTDAAREIYPNIIRNKEIMERILMQGISEDEFRQFSDTLKKIRRNIKKYEEDKAGELND